MSVLFVLIPVATIFSIAAVWVFIWSVRAGQLDDLSTPPIRVLLDEDQIIPQPAQKENAS